MRLKKYILAVYLLFVSLTFAQDNLNILKYYSISDSVEVDPYSFFPMQVGNFWQYAFLDEIVLEEYVHKDSLLNDNSRLIYLIYNGINYNTPSLIIDTAYRVYSWHPFLPYWEFLYKLDAKINEEWWIRHLTADTTVGDFKRVEEVYYGSYLGVETTFKNIAEFSREIIGGEYIDIFRGREIIASGLGVVLKYDDFLGKPPEYLLSAVIDGDTLGTIVSVEDIEPSVIEDSFHLAQNYPNPFNASTTISYCIANNGTVLLRVFDILGHELSTLVNENQAAGEYSVQFNALDIPSGIYIYQLIANSRKISSKKMIYLK